MKSKSTEHRDCIWWPATLDVSAGRQLSCQKQGPRSPVIGSTVVLVMCVVLGQGDFVAHLLGWETSTSSTMRSRRVRCMTGPS